MKGSMPRILQYGPPFLDIYSDGSSVCKLLLLTLYLLCNPINRLVVIRKTCPCNVYTLEPHFYIAKMGYAGVYLFFLFLLQNIDCGYSLEPPRRGDSNVYLKSMF